jgi:hypothetical protein
MAETSCESEKEKGKISCSVGRCIVCEEYINAAGCLNTILCCTFIKASF